MKQTEETEQSGKEKQKKRKRKRIEENKGHTYISQKKEGKQKRKP